MLSQVQVQRDEIAEHAVQLKAELSNCRAINTKQVAALKASAWQDAKQMHELKAKLLSMTAASGEEHAALTSSSVEEELCRLQESFQTASRCQEEELLTAKSKLKDAIRRGADSQMKTMQAADATLSELRAEHVAEIASLKLELESLRTEYEGKLTQSHTALAKAEQQLETRATEVHIQKLSQEKDQLDLQLGQAQRARATKAARAMRDSEMMVSFVYGFSVL